MCCRCSDHNSLKILLFQQPSFRKLAWSRKKINYIINYDYGKVKSSVGLKMIQSYTLTSTQLTSLLVLRLWFQSTYSTALHDFRYSKVNKIRWRITSNFTTHNIPVEYHQPKHSTTFGDICAYLLPLYM